MDDIQYFRLSCPPGFQLCGVRFDYLVFEWADTPPRRGYFVAKVDDDQWKLCMVVPAEDCSNGEPFMFCVDGSKYPQGAQVFGVLKCGYIKFTEEEESVD